MQEMLTFCRLCLCQDRCLVSLAAVAESSFSVQDLERIAGVRVPEDECSFYSICVQCTKTVENTLSFRRSCQDNNILFRQLFAEAANDHLCSGSPTELLTEGPKVKAFQMMVEFVLPNMGPTIVGEPGDFAETTFEATDFKCKELTEETGSKESSNEYQGTDATSVTSAAEEGNERSKREDTPDRSSNSLSGSRPKRLCNVCGAMVCDIRGHTRAHTQQTLFPCPHCPKQMTTKGNLSSHVHTVHEKRIIKSCQKCDLGFTTKNSYQSHMRTHHDAGRPYLCQVCLKQFKHPSNYRDHTNRAHSKHTNFECTFCGKRFKAMKILRNHLMVHSSDRPYACSHCPKRFKSSYARKTHEITHSGTVFPCSLCVKVYRYKSVLKEHYKKAHAEM
ncbi:zinc finger protein 32-like [Anopheles bellator]|uniref:zinc finger protein 32-like n=1 Tax=Anopheles bellator TaxID=139047 RepID=UPI00264760AD|nr:zinc finger protein 32-like [Anopheles bellator]